MDKVKNRITGSGHWQNVSKFWAYLIAILIFFDETFRKVNSWVYKIHWLYGIRYYGDLSIRDSFTGSSSLYRLHADLVTFTEEILNEKLHFLCSDPTLDVPL